MITSRIKSKWGRIVLQVVLDQSIGASLVNSGYFAVHTVVLAGLTGRAFPLPALGSSIVEKVRCYMHSYNIALFFWSYTGEIRNADVRTYWLSAGLVRSDMYHVFPRDGLASCKTLLCFFFLIGWRRVLARASFLPWR